jgi:hypothetical protein
MIQYASLTASVYVAVAQPVQADSTGGSTDWVSYLLNGGPFAIVLLLVLLDKLGTNSERDRLRAENASLRTQNQELNDTIIEKVIAPLTDQNRLMGDLVKLLDDEDRFPRRRPAPRRSS